MYDIFEELMEQKGVKAADVAKATGIAPQTLSAWKKGFSTPKQDKLKLIADYFNVTVDYLLGVDEVQLSRDYRNMYVTELLHDPKIEELVMFAGAIFPRRNRYAFIDAFITAYNAAKSAKTLHQIAEEIHADEDTES